MLVLTRKANESIVIGDDIVVTVIEANGGRVRIGIVAPKTVSIQRQEIYDKIQAAKQGVVAVISNRPGSGVGDPAKVPHTSNIEEESFWSDRGRVLIGGSRGQSLRGDLVGTAEKDRSASESDSRGLRFRIVIDADVPAAKVAEHLKEVYRLLNDYLVEQHGTYLPADEFRRLVLEEAKRGAEA